MATVKIPIDVRSAIPDITVGAQHAAFQNTSATTPGIAALAFDAGATDEIVFFQLKAANYGSGNLTLNIFWYADTASSGDVIFAAAIAVITPNTDSQDIETKTFATETTVTDSHLGTTGQRLHQCAITISNLDSLAADDWFSLKLKRNSSSASDTMTGDALVVDLELTYSDA